MGKKGRVLDILFVVFVCFFVFSFVHGQEVTHISIALPRLASGATGRIEAKIDCHADVCSAFDVVLSFDPTLLQIDDLYVGEYLGANVLEAEHTIDNLNGTAHLAATVLGAHEGGAGDTLFLAEVTPHDSGIVQIEVEQLLIGDSVGEQIPVTWEVVPADAAMDVFFFVTGQVVNLRAAPGVDSPVVDTATQTDELRVIARVGVGYNTWYQVLLEDGDEAWIWANVGILSEDEITLPIADDIRVGAAPPTPAPPTNAPISTPAPDISNNTGSDSGQSQGNSGDPGGANPQPPPPTVNPDDLDGDGTPNGGDSCPNEAGSSSFHIYACPDRDGDGWADSLDQCPDAAAQNYYCQPQGCPSASGCCGHMCPG